jgi:ParB family transcriptional regulator, chromosome partitioning protein
MDPQKFALVCTASLQRNPNDKRDRSTSAYREWLAQLTRDIKERGIRNPIQAMRNGDVLVVLAGETRRQAAIAAGMDKVPVNILDRPLTAGEMLMEALLENDMRRDFTDLERAEMYADIMKANSWSQVELAHHLKTTPGQVSKVLAVSSKLPEDVKALIGKGEGKVGPRAGYHISRLSDHGAMREMARKLLDGLLTTEALEVEVAKRVGKRPKKAKVVKGKTPKGLSFLLPPDFATAQAEVATLMETIKKAEKLGLPLSSVPTLLKGM